MDTARTNEYKLPILTYHSIDHSGSVVSTNRETFRKQMQYLSESSFKVISLGEVATFIHKDRPFPPKTVAIAFDDGYKSVYTEAFPILKEYGFKGTVFLITDYCGKHNDWPGNSPSLGRRPLLTWDEIKEMHKYGFEFGAHTLTHPDLTHVPVKEAEREVRQSKLEIQDHLGVEVTIFAYPYGRYDAKIKGIIQNYFDGACSTKLGKVGVGSDPFLLKRMDTYYLSNYKLFSKLTTASLAWYLGLRQALRDLRNIT